MAGKIALVTGATSGIGLGIAQKLASQGYTIHINGFGAVDEIARAIQSIEAHGGKANHHPVDMTHVEQIEEMMKNIMEKDGPLSVVVNNAGIQFVSPLEDFPTDKWNQIIALNLSAAFHTIRLSIKGMKELGWGRVVNIASAHALVASPFKSAYVAAKHGIAGLTKVTALEAASFGVTCNAICPGYVKTPLVENQIAATAKARKITPEEVIHDVMLGNQPTKKFVTIEEVAALAAFLISDEGASITGACLPIDGGWTAH